MENIRIAEMVSSQAVKNPSNSPFKRLSREERESVFENEQEDAFLVQDHFDRLKVAELSTTLLALFGFACASIIYDLSYLGNSNYEPILEFLFAMCSISTILLLISITWRTYLDFIWERGKGIHAQHQNLISSGKYKLLLFELVINSLHPMWFLEGQTFSHWNDIIKASADYSYNAILVCVSLLRLYHSIRLLSISTYYRSSRAQRVCQMNGTISGNGFAMKCLMKENPLLVVMVMMVFGILAGGFLLRIFERPFYPASTMDFSDYGNAMWLMILTMTTVGYGDYYPVTFLGRLIVLVVCFWGVLVVSLMVITLSNMLELESGERNALLLFKRLQFKEALRKEAAHVIAAVIRYHRLRKTDGDNAKKLKEQVGNIKIQVNTFHNLKMQQRVLYGLDSDVDRIERKLASLVEGSENTSKTIERAMELLKSLKINMVA